MEKVEQVIVYIISTHYGTFYTGITNNLIRRWKEHRTGKSSYLRRYKPKEVIHIEFFNTRTEARRKEVKIKKTGANKYITKLKFQ